MTLERVLSKSSHISGSLHHLQTFLKEGIRTVIVCHPEFISESIFNEKMLNQIQHEEREIVNYLLH